MLTERDHLVEQADLERRLRSAVAQMLRGLGRVPRAAHRARAALLPQEPVSIDKLLESQERALRHARGIAGDPLRGLAAVHELVEEVRCGMASPRILDDLSEMLAEAPGPAEVRQVSVRRAQRALRVLETLVRRAEADADRLFVLAVTAQQVLPDGVKMDSKDSRPVIQSPVADATSLAVRELSEVVAATFADARPPYPAVPAPTVGRLEVTDLRNATLQAMGLPMHLSADWRTRLIDGLNRNFMSRDEQGTRVYYRSASQASTPDEDVDHEGLSGSVKVNAEVLQAMTRGVIEIVGRLPDMLRFVATQRLDTTAMRDRLPVLAQQLIATVSDPLGPNVQRGRFQFQRWSVAILELLRTGEIVEIDNWPPSAKDDIPLLFERLAQKEADWDSDRLRIPASVVRNEEVVAELAALGQLMTDIRQRVMPTTQPGQGRGLAADRLDELLAAADGAATMLGSELDRFGTTAAESRVVPMAKEGVSLAQLIGWVHATCAPFIQPGNAAADLLPAELSILRDELAEIGKCMHEQFDLHTFNPVRFGGVRRQFEELRSYIVQAAQQAGLLAGGSPVARA